MSACWSTGVLGEYCSVNVVLVVFGCEGCIWLRRMYLAVDDAVVRIGTNTLVKSVDSLRLR
jgi:hypothetical protein